MSTRWGYLVRVDTGESVPLESCLIVRPSGGTRPWVMDKRSGKNYADDASWKFVRGADDAADEMRTHPSYRLKMMNAALSGEHVAACADVVQEMLG